VHTVVDSLNISPISSSCYCYLKESFGDWTLPLSSGKKLTQLGSIDRVKSRSSDDMEASYLTMEAWSNILNVLNKYRTTNNVQKVNNSIRIENTPVAGLSLQLSR
jgi:hypothetical protein